MGWGARAAPRNSAVSTLSLSHFLCNTLKNTFGFTNFVRSDHPTSIWSHFHHKSGADLQGGESFNFIISFAARFIDIYIYSHIWVYDRTFKLKSTEIWLLDLVSFGICWSEGVRVSNGGLWSPKTTSHGGRRWLTVCCVHLGRKLKLKSIKI